MRRQTWHALVVAIGIAVFPASTGLAQVPPAKPADLLPGMEPLALEGPLDEAMVAGIDRWLTARLAATPAARRAGWTTDRGGDAAARRARLREIVGAVDDRVAAPDPAARQSAPAGFPLETYDIAGAALADRGPGAGVVVRRARYDVLPGATADGLWLVPPRPRAVVIALGDADWTPEQFAGLVPGVPEQAQLPRRLAAAGAAVFVPTLVDRDCTHSGNPAVRFTNQPHREFLYRMAFQLGRHPLGYEVQKILAGVDRCRGSGGTAAVESAAGAARPLPLGVCGVGEGGQAALVAAALDERIDAALVCGYFGPREGVWEEPIYRSIWSQLLAHGDAEIAALVTPRPLTIEVCAVPEVTGPPPPRSDRRGAAPGRIVNRTEAEVRGEVARAREAAAALAGGTQSAAAAAAAIELFVADGGAGPAGGREAVAAFTKRLGLESAAADSAPASAAPAAASPVIETDIAKRQARQFAELVQFTQRVHDVCDRTRARVWRGFAPADPAAAERAAGRYRDLVHDSFIGRLPTPEVPPRPRCRRVLDDPGFTGWEIALDVHPDVIAGGMLLVPKDIAPGERRAVVVCQHGLEGRPIDTITGEGSEGYAPYKAFAARLARLGWVVYAPQNPYRGQDRFRVLQRKANPLGLSLFSFIVAQHERTLGVLAALPFVDPGRIGFYGLSYGGKTAMRVPALVPRYALSICSGDFNDWIRKCVTVEHGTSYMFHGEYEMPEWNMGHVANYAELAWLVAPRPFMVERGHRDGCAPDEWVAAEYAKARLPFVRMGIPDRTEIEWFDGPHTINGAGTFRFLQKFLPPRAPPPEPAR